MNTRQHASVQLGVETLEDRCVPDANLGGAILAGAGVSARLAPIPGSYGMALDVQGTRFGDTIWISQANGKVTVVTTTKLGSGLVARKTRSFNEASVYTIRVDGRGGNDHLFLHDKRGLNQPLASASVNGGPGKDQIVGGNGFNLLNGGSGNDTIRGGRARNWIQGGSDQDMLLGGSSHDIIDGGDGYDWLEGGGGIDFLLNGEQGHTREFFGRIDAVAAYNTLAGNLWTRGFGDSNTVDRQVPFYFPPVAGSREIFGVYLRMMVKPISGSDTDTDTLVLRDANGYTHVVFANFRDRTATHEALTQGVQNLVQFDLSQERWLWETMQRGVAIEGLVQDDTAVISMQLILGTR